LKLHNVQFCELLMFPSLAELKDLVVVNFSVEGSSLRRAEEQAWVNFADFLDECEGKENIFQIVD